MILGLSTCFRIGLKCCVRKHCHLAYWYFYFFSGLVKGKVKQYRTNLHPNCNWRLISFGFYRGFNPKYPTGVAIGWVG